MMLEDKSIVSVDRCVFELRQGRPVIVAGQSSTWLVGGIELQAEAQRHVLSALAPERVVLLLTANRAASLGLGGGAVALPVAAIDGHGGLERLGFGQPTPADLARARRAVLPVAGDVSVHAAFGLARLAETVPALLGIRSIPETAAALTALRDRGTVLATSAMAVQAFRQANAANIRRLAEAPVPLANSNDTRFVAYRSRDSLTDHVAVVIGQPETQTAPLVRLHSACLTGDIFHSLRCDCGEQLDTAIATMTQHGGGVICYLAQEGRGIGIANKLRAYALQNAGLDTLEANEALGFDADEREFAIAALMIRDLGLGRIRLMTNNPEKIDGIVKAGIEVTERVGLAATLNPHNERYIAARVAKKGYLHAVNG
ncbi:MAG: GTP cyclohydrolase II [Geminicoccaceae bacterium]|nr:MAG: GTP cyclohydrolase II [Geminicoccaceae bacterium]